MIKAILFDFDGVILESVDIKTEAFVELFKDYPAHVGKIREHHINNTGVSRFDKIKHYLNEIIQAPVSEKNYKNYLNRFGEIVLQKVIQAEFVPGIQDFLEKYHKKYDLYVVSATPTEEIRLIVEEKNLGKYFKEVFGSPTAKSQWVNMIIKDKYKKNEVIFVGDALSDYRAAAENGIPFIGRISDRNINPFRGLNLKHLLIDMTRLPEIIEAA